MRELSKMEIGIVNGSFKFNLGTAIAAIAVGIVTGGPVGLGYALCGIVIAHGVNSLEEMANDI